MAPVPTDTKVVWAAAVAALTPSASNATMANLNALLVHPPACISIPPYGRWLYFVRLHQDPVCELVAGRGNRDSAA